MAGPCCDLSMPALSAGSGNTTDVHELLAALVSRAPLHTHSQEDCVFLQDIFGDESLRSLIMVHQRLQQYVAQGPAPVQVGVGTLAHELARELQSSGVHGEKQDLLSLLSNPHVESLLFAHDVIAQKGYDPEPELPPLPDDIESCEDSVKIVRLVRNREPLGATIKRDRESGAMVVARIMRGGAADRSGLINEGDELREVNGIPMEDKGPEDILPILTQFQGAVTFKVIPGMKTEMESSHDRVHHGIFVRCLFDYDPNEDKAIPCKEAGLAFKKGDVLQVMHQDDATWWQARHDGNTSPRASLIPSRQFQERRFALRSPVDLVRTQKLSKCRSYGAVECAKADDVDYRAISGIHIAGLRRSYRLSGRDRKTHQSVWGSPQSEQYDAVDVPPTYEQVAAYRRAPGARHRLVLLIGPGGVGLSELKRRLVTSDPEHFGVTVPHTTRPKRTQETNGVEYHFISKQEFEADVHNNKFIDHGEYAGHYYGTAVDAVRAVLAKNQVCLLDAQPQTIKHLRTSEFKPFVVFVKPPPVDRLRLTRRRARVFSNPDETGSPKLFSEEDFQEMIVSAQVMENLYGHLFETVIVNDDLAMAFNELKAVLRKVETERHWVPVNWHSAKSGRGGWC